MVSVPSAGVRSPRRAHGTNPLDCVVDQDFAPYESKMPRRAKKCSVGFSIRSFTRFPCADHPAEEVHHLLGPRQAAEITMNDNAVEAVIDKDQEIAEQFVKQVHWQAPQCPGKIDQATAASAGAGSRARAFVLPMRSATSSAAPPSTMGVSSPSVNLRCSPPKPATPGSSTVKITSPSGSPARATPNH